MPCQECGKLFASAERVRVHVRVAHGEKTCACEICGCGFSYRCKLMNHMRTHTGKKDTLYSVTNFVWQPNLRPSLLCNNTHCLLQVISHLHVKSADGPSRRRTTSSDIT